MPRWRGISITDRRKGIACLPQDIRRLDREGNAIELRVHVTGLEEITRWILSWGSKARVIAPGVLKERVRAEAKQMARQD